MRTTTVTMYLARDRRRVTRLSRELSSLADQVKTTITQLGRAGVRACADQAGESDRIWHLSANLDRLERALARKHEELDDVFRTGKVTVGGKWARLWHRLRYGGRTVTADMAMTNNLAEIYDNPDVIYCPHGKTKRPS